MAREIKITVKGNEDYNVRGIPDALARGEEVVAARWQEGDRIKAFVTRADMKGILEKESGVSCELNTSPLGLAKYIAENF